MNADCLFCKIIAKQIPSQGVYEDEDVYAFLDIKPVNRGHVLVVPKAHSAGFDDADPEVLKKHVVAMQKIARALKAAMGVPAFNLMQNNGEVAGQVIPHLHFHIIPRRADDGLKHWPNGTYAEGEAERVAEQIRAKI